MKSMILIFCLFTILSSRTIGIAAESKQNGACPVAVRMYDEFVIVGGLSNARWVPARQIEKSLPVSASYKMYSVTGFIGRGIGRTNKTSELQDYISLPIISIHPTSKAKQITQSASLAVAGDWNVMLRDVKKNHNHNIYKNQVKDYLAGKGILTDTPVIDQELQVDLDGDGSIETVVAGSRYQNSKYDSPEPEIGDYTYVIVLSKKNNTISCRTLEGIFFANEKSLQKNEWTSYKVTGIADVDADKVMEVATVGEFFEGGTIKISKVKGNELSELRITGK